MNNSFSRIPQYITLGIVFGSLAVMGCGQGDTADLEARITELESQLQAEQQKTVTLSTAMTSSRTSVFDSPLHQFFSAPEFWETVYEDTGACHNSCYEAHVQGIEGCREEDDVEACEQNVAEETVACHGECGSGDGPVP